MEDLEKEMDIKEEIEELKNKINELEEKIEKETKDIANNEWKPTYDEAYYYVDLDVMQTNCSGWNYNDIDNTRLKHKVIFKTEEKAEEYLEYLKEKEKYMNTFTAEEWENFDVKKWHYYYDCKAKTISCAFKRYVKENMSYFKTEEETRDFIYEYDWQIKHELGVE